MSNLTIKRGMSLFAGLILAVFGMSVSASPAQASSTNCAGACMAVVGSGWTVNTASTYLSSSVCNIAFPYAHIYTSDNSNVDVTWRNYSLSGCGTLTFWVNNWTATSNTHIYGAINTSAQCYTPGVVWINK